MKDNFDIHEWNKNRYLKEGINDRVLKANLSDLSYDNLEVSGGTDAMLEWFKMIETKDKNQKK